MLAPLHTFSRIGYNRRRTQAMVYVGYRCDGMCGDGQIVLLERRGGRWTITQTQRLWIS